VDLDERRLRDEDDREAPPPQVARPLTAILPDGRSVRLAVPVPLASASALDDLARFAERRALQFHASTRRQQSSVRALSRTIAGDLERLSASQTARAATIRRRLVARHKRLDERVTKAAAEFRAKVDRQLKIETESAARLRRRDLWDKIVIASSLPLFAAYGQPGQLSNTTNLALTLSLLIWLVGDDVVRTLFGSDEKSAYPWRDTDIWSYLAPLGNVLTAWWLFGDRQHERFITGVTTVNAATGTALTGPFPQSNRVDLSKHVAPDHCDDFSTYKEVPVVAVVSRADLPPGASVRGLAACVNGGRLDITFEVTTAAPVAGPMPFGQVDVAWVVDTAEPQATS
jgi:hypothetical protein